MEKQKVAIVYFKFKRELYNEISHALRTILVMKKNHYVIEAF